MTARMNNFSFNLSNSFLCKWYLSTIHQWVAVLCFLATAWLYRNKQNLIMVQFDLSPLCVWHLVHAYCFSYRSQELPVIVGYLLRFVFFYLFLFNFEIFHFHAWFYLPTSFWCTCIELTNYPSQNIQYLPCFPLFICRSCYSTVAGRMWIQMETQDTGTNSKSTKTGQKKEKKKKSQKIRQQGKETRKHFLVSQRAKNTDNTYTK